LTLTAINNYERQDENLCLFIFLQLMILTSRCYRNRRSVPAQVCLENYLRWECYVIL